MPLETPQFLNGLVASNPAPGDAASQGDDHLRLIKAVLLATFPGLTGAMTLTQDVLNALPASSKSYTDSTVASAISNEITARNNAIGQNIANEVSNRNNAISGSFNAEGAERARQDGILQGNINAEANTRANAINDTNARFSGYTPLNTLRWGDYGNGYYHLDMPCIYENNGGELRTLRISMGYGIGASNGNYVSYGPANSTSYVSGPIILTSDQSAGGNTIGAWRRDSTSFIVWVHDANGNPTSSNFNFLAIGMI